MTLRTRRLLCRALLSFSAAFIMLVQPGQAATINVPADQKTIQAGIDAASNGDTVLVAPGTYYENIDFKGKAITVTSSGGPALTTIDGGYLPGAPTVSFTNGEALTSVISNFTIRGGGVSFNAQMPNGGVYAFGSSPTIENNTVTSNYCHNIDVEGGAAMITGNEISVLQQNPPPLGACSFQSAVHLEVVAGVSTSAGSSIIGNIIENNLTGTGIEIFGGQNDLIMNNIIRHNTSPDTGSAVDLDGESTVLLQNLIYGNTSTCGGAISFSDAGFVPGSPSILIANNTIVDNITVESSNGSDCTPVAQIYPESYGESDPSAVIVNNVISGGTTYPAVECFLFAPPSEAVQPSFEYDLLYNSGGPFFGSRCIDVSGKYNNIVAAPQFVNPSIGDYHLKSASPAIDKGQNSVLQTFMTMTGRTFTTDFDGKPRLQDAQGSGCTIDMGAYEYPGTTSDCSSTTETLQSSLNPSSFGENVTFTAQLSSSNGVPTGDVQFTEGTTTLGTGTISTAGVATISTNTLTVGSHSITATYYQPSGGLPPATATLTQVVNGYATNTALMSSANPANVGQSVTFTATVSSSNGTPAGLITFSDAATTLGTQTLINGVATFTTSTLATGTHPIAAAYSPTGTSFNASNTSLSEIINGTPTATSLTVAPTTAIYGTNIVMTAAVNLFGSPNISGGITFMDGASAIATGELAPGSVTSIYNDIYLTVGTHTITAVYTGDATHNPSTSPAVTVTITAAPSTLSLSATPNPAYTVQPITLMAKLAGGPAGGTAGSPVSFSANGKLIGSATTDNQGNAALTASLLAGTYSLTASFAGSASLAASTSAPVTEVVNLTLTTTAVSAQPNPGYQGGNEILTASVNALFSSGTGAPSIPSGNVTFLDAGSPIANAGLDATGHATYSTTAFAVGDHLITAVYNGSTSLAASTSAGYPLDILPRDFILTADSTITIETEHHKSLALTLSSVGDFSDHVELTCGPMPAFASCTFPGNASLLAAGSTRPATVSINTDAIYNYVASSELPTPTTRIRSGIAFALLLPMPLAAIMRRRRALRRAISLFAGLLVFLIAFTFTGCSGHYPGHTPPGTYAFTITAQGAATHITHTATVTLIVTQ